MCLMKKILNKYLEKFILVFVDDILVYFNTKEENEGNIRLVLRDYQLYTKYSKCDFFQREIQYLGDTISEEGVVVDPKNIKEIMDWPTPQNMYEVIHSWD
jgi:hypothetical protein